MRVHPQNRLTMVVFGVGLLCTVGCGKEATTPSGAPVSSDLKKTRSISDNSTPSESNSLYSMTDLDKVTRAKKPYKLVLIVKTRSNAFFKPMIDRFTETAKALGITPLVDAPPEEIDSEKQVAYVQNEVAKGVDAILIAPADSKAIIPSLKAAQEKGVLVINLDNRVDRGAAEAQGLKLGGYVGADNRAGGSLAGKAMLTALKGNGKVAVLEGIRGADNAEARKQGFLEAVHGKLAITDSETADWDTHKAYAKTHNILAAHPDLNGIFCANDMMALGAIQAISEAGKKGKITVVGYDNIPRAKEALQSGEMAATIEQHPDLMGLYGAKMAVGILDGVVPRGNNILVNLDTITK